MHVQILSKYQTCVRDVLTAISGEFIGMCYLCSLAKINFAHATYSNNGIRVQRCPDVVTFASAHTYHDVCRMHDPPQHAYKYTVTHHMYSTEYRRLGALKKKTNKHTFKFCKSTDMYAGPLLTIV